MVLDIEGTVAPISFVYDVLFPYVTAHLEEYLTRTWDSAQTKAEVNELLAQVHRFGTYASSPCKNSSFECKCSVPMRSAFACSLTLLE